MAKLILSQNGTVLAVQPVQSGSLLIGRGLACRLRIPDIGIESQHALLISDGKRTVLEPLCGVVRVNDTSIRSQELKFGDEIKIGRYSILFAPNYIHDTTKVQKNSTLFYGRKNSHKIGFLQILNGKHLGRIISLDHAMIRFGRAGKCALISHRKNGYYISTLEGNTRPTIKNVPIEDCGQHLEEGDVLQVGSTRVQFFINSSFSSSPPPKQVPTMVTHGNQLH